MKLNNLLISIFDAEESQIKDDVKLADFEAWDSMAHMMFITRLEEEYAINLTGDEIAGIKTVGDVKKILTQKGKLD